MRKTMATFIILALAAVFAGSAFAAEEAEQVTGTVISYVAGKSITIQNDDGSYTFDISEDTEVEGNISEGLKVLVEGEGSAAFYIAMIEAEG